jgi:4-amino-4-deoxyprephenate dehydrogenase
VSCQPECHGPFARIVILGAGAVGLLMSKVLTAPERQILLYDLCPKVGVRSGDASNPDEELTAELRHADLVILSLPQPAITAALPTVSQLVAATTLMVETGSVKSPLTAVVDSASTGVEIVGINPMFAPSLGFAGQNVVMIQHRPGPRAALFAHFLSAWGATTTTLTAEQHDQLTALGQNAVHCVLLALGMTLARCAPDSKTLLQTATPPLRALLLLLGRMLRQSPEVYWDIQTANPFAKSARAVLLNSLGDLDQIVASNSGHAAFHAELSALAENLLPVLSSSTATSDEMLRAIPATAFI